MNKGTFGVKVNTTNTLVVLALGVALGYAICKQQQKKLY